MTMIHRIRVFVGAAVLGILPAQNESRGLLAGSATTFFLDGLLAFEHATTMVHPNGFSQLAPLMFPDQTSGGPVTFPNLRAILKQYGAPPLLDVDDFSTGRDELLIDCNGVLSVPPNSWSVWSFSLQGNAVGAPGSVIAAEAQFGSVGNALFSWVLPGSNLPAQVVGVTERSHSRRELGIGTLGELDGVDFPLVLGLDQQLANNGIAVAVEPNFAPLIAAPAGYPQRIYFTVSHATRQLVPPWWWGGTQPSGATVFCTVQQSPTFWQAPTVFLSFADLGLQPDDDIDALAYDRLNDRILFSLTDPNTDQFLTVDLCDDGPPVPMPVMQTNGTPVSQSVGKAQNDVVDAVCTLDPRRPTGGPTPPDDFGSSVGTPRPGLFGVPSVSGSAYRRFQGGLVRFDTFMVGWPPNAGQAPGLAVAFLTTGNNIDPVLIGGLHVRNVGSPIPGDPQTETVVVPAALALTGLPVTLRWIALDFATGELAEAWPVEVFL